MELEQSHEMEEMFDRQDAALRLLTKLRLKSYPTANNIVQSSNQRRQYRRWAAPESIAIAIFTDDWQVLDVIDVGIGGVKVKRNDRLPSSGPFVCKLSVGGLDNVFVIADIMWMSDHTVGIRFEFDKQDEHDLWAENLVDTLLSKLSI
ncbi:MAG: PilZ domain-containing protein [Armatimonadota bacterium]